MPEPDRGERLGGHPPALGPAQTPVDERQAGVGHGRGAGQELEALEHEPDDLVADRGQLVLGQPGDVAPVEAQGPRGRPVQPAEQPEQGRLARPAGAHDGHRVAPLHHQVDPVKGPNLDPVEAVQLGHADGLDHRGAGLEHGQPPGPGQS
jgi:hypothetical protein